jgi:hypothetical protein
MVSGDAGPNGPNAISIVELALLSERESAENRRTEVWTVKGVLRTIRNAQHEYNVLV